MNYIEQLERRVEEYSGIVRNLEYQLECANRGKAPWIWILEATITSIFRYNKTEMTQSTVHKANVVMGRATEAYRHLMKSIHLYNRGDDMKLDEISIQRGKIINGTNLPNGYFKMAWVVILKNKNASGMYIESIWSNNKYHLFRATPPNTDLTLKILLEYINKKETMIDRLH